MKHRANFLRPLVLAASVVLTVRAAAVADEPARDLAAPDPAVGALTLESAPRWAAFFPVAPARRAVVTHDAYDQRISDSFVKSSFAESSFCDEAPIRATARRAEPSVPATPTVEAANDSLSLSRARPRAKLT